MYRYNPTNNNIIKTDSLNGSILKSYPESSDNTGSSMTINGILHVEEDTASCTMFVY